MSYNNTTFIIPQSKISPVCIICLWFIMISKLHFTSLNHSYPELRLPFSSQYISYMDVVRYKGLVIWNLLKVKWKAS